MRKFLTLFSAAALLATPALSHARGFDYDFSQAVNGPFKLEVVVSEELAHLANNLPKKLSDRSRGNRVTGGLSNNGKYGEREIEILLKRMQEKIARDFAKRDIQLSDSAATLLRVTINEVKPNRPTFSQRSSEPSLSFLNLAIGGADVSAEIIAADGGVIGTADYDYFSRFGDPHLRGTVTWSDTHRAFARFSKHLSKKLSRAST